MRYDPVTQAAMSNPADWILLLLVLGAVAAMSVLIVFGVLGIVVNRPSEQ
jgi:hypothetical protein